MTLATISELEAASLKAWPAIEEEWHGNWVARFSRGYSNRANSMQSLDPTDDADASARIAHITSAYRSRGLPPIFRVTPLAGPTAIAALDSQNWQTYGHSLVLTMDLPKTMRPVSAPTRYFEPNDPQWWQMQAAMAMQADTDALGDILSRILAPARGVLLYADDHQPVAACLVVNADGIAMFLNVVVAQTARGQGLGRAVMHAGLNWAVQAGARQASLQVGADNTVARALYRSLGFAEAYAYHYRRTPQ